MELRKASTWSAAIATMASPPVSPEICASHAAAAPVTLEEVCARIQTHATNARGALAVAPLGCPEIAPVAPVSPGTPGIPVTPAVYSSTHLAIPTMRRQYASACIADQHVLLDLIVAELNVERDEAGCPVSHPPTLPPSASAFATPQNSKDAPSNDVNNYVGYGGVSRWALACTCRDIAAAVRATPASPWCAKMSRRLARERALHAMRKPTLASTELALLWVRTLAPWPFSEGARADSGDVVARAIRSNAYTKWYDLAEDALFASALQLARGGQNANGRVRAHAQITIDALGGSPGTKLRILRTWASRISLFAQFPHGGDTYLLMFVDELCNVGKQAAVAHDAVVELDTVCAIVAGMQMAVLDYGLTSVPEHKLQGTWAADVLDHIVSLLRTHGLLLVD